VRRRLGIVPPLTPGAVLRPPLARPAFPLGDRHCRQTAHAGDALRLGVRELGLGDGDEILVPAQHDPRMLRALHAAGVRSRQYAGTASLAPDGDELESLIDPAVRALYVVHHLGFPQDSERWRTWCDERGLLLIEDATHAIGASSDGRPAGGIADMAVFGLAECLGTPDGAIVRLAAAPSGTLAEGGAGTLALARLLVCDVADGEEPETAPAGAPVRAASATTARLLSRLADETAAPARRANYARLLERLGERVPAPFDRLPPGAAPFALPLRADAGDGLRERLEDRGVQTRSGWPAPDGALLVPVHPRLRARDLERITDAAVAHRPRRVVEELELEELQGFDVLADDWKRLAHATDTIFATPQWLGTWWRHYGREDELRLYACRDRMGRVVAILPLELHAMGPLAVMRFVGHGPSDQLGPICAPADRPAVARALLRATDEAGADVLLGEQLPGDAAWPALLGGAVLSREGNPVVHFATGGWDAQLKRWTPSVGRLLRRYTRRLEAAHAVRTRRTLSPAALERDLDILFSLHRARWAADGSAFGTRDAAFHREFAAIALQQGWLQMSFLEVDGEDVAGEYHLRFGRAGYVYQGGWLPQWERYSVGTIALMRSIRISCDDGLGEMRFLRGGETYKYRYADADPGLQTIAVARRRAAAGALAVARAAPRKVLKPVRRWVAAT
jgi:CelD/BcsL family acetyltransferase involved in cellulose biosynthesis